MATALLEAPEAPTLDELLVRLGNVPPSRILSRPAPGTATEADCIRLVEAVNGRSVELLEGTLVEKAMGQEESILGSWLGRKIGNFAEEHHLGMCSGEQSLLKLRLGRIRMPDFAFFSWKNIRGVKRAAAPMMVPDLVVEVISPSNRAKEIAIKRRDFFEFGTELFWVVEPRKRVVVVHTSDRQSKILTEVEILTGEPVLPGFAIPVKAIFDQLDYLHEMMHG